MANFFKHYFRQYTRSELDYFLSLAEMHERKTPEMIDRIRFAMDGKFPLKKRSSAYVAFCDIVRFGKYAGWTHYKHKDFSIKVFLSSQMRERQCPP